MNRLFAAALAVAIVSASPAAADEFFAVTPSGATEMMFGEKPEKAIGALASKCIDSKMTVISSTPSELVCEAPLNFGQSLLGTMLLGNSYSTPPRKFFRFNAATVNGLSRVQASGWMELQMAFGQVRRTDFSGPEFHNSLMNFMGLAGGKLPIGTTFPNHVVMGYEADNIQRGKVTVMQVKAVTAGFPAERAGMAAGDLVLKIAGKALKNGDDFLDATAKAAKTPTYPVEIERGGKVVKLTLNRVFRPAITETAVVAAEAAVPASPPASVADELAKLGKLKAEGLLTEAEFQAQKKKLLGL